MISLLKRMLIMQSEKKIVDLANYPELSDFRSSTACDKITSYYQIYHSTKKRVFVYKAIFFLFTILFAFLAFYIYSKTPVFLMSSLKPFVSFASVSFSLWSFYTFFSISLEKEAIKKVYNKHIVLLNSLYGQEKTRSHSDSFQDFIKQRTALRRSYKHVREKLKHKEIETLHLLDRIRHTQELDFQEKEKLNHQALLELQDQFAEIIQHYKLHIGI